MVNPKLLIFSSHHVVSKEARLIKYLNSTRNAVCVINGRHLIGANLDLAFGRTKEQGSNSKLWDSPPLVVKVMAKYYISINIGIFH